MAKKWIRGTVQFVNIGPGFYGIVDKKGNEYRPVNFPEQLKNPGQEVSLLVESVDEMSVFMWGKSVRVRGFKS